MNNILFVIVGAIVGVVSRLIGPAKAPGPVVGSLFVGIMGAFGGQVVGRLSGFSRDDTADFLTALVGAALFAVLYHAAVLRISTSNAGHDHA